jgi:hypothetical protein
MRELTRTLRWFLLALANTILLNRGRGGGHYIQSASSKGKVRWRPPYSFSLTPSSLVFGGYSVRETKEIGIAIALMRPRFSLSNRERVKLGRKTRKAVGACAP